MTGCTDFRRRSALRHIAGDEGVFMPEPGVVDELLRDGLVVERDPDATRYKDRYSVTDKGERLLERGREEDTRDLVCFDSAFRYEGADNITHATLDGARTLCGRTGWQTSEGWHEMGPDCQKCRRSLEKHEAAEVRATSGPTFALRHAYTSRCTGNYTGKDHVVVATGVLKQGRLRRSPGDALCKPSSKFWGLMQGSDGPDQAKHTCAECLARAERLGIEVTNLSHDTKVGSTT